MGGYLENDFRSIPRIDIRVPLYGQEFGPQILRVYTELRLSFLFECWLYSRWCRVVDDIAPILRLQTDPVTVMAVCEYRDRMSAVAASGVRSGTAERSLTGASDTPAGGSHRLGPGSWLERNYTVRGDSRGTKSHQPVGDAGGRPCLRTLTHRSRKTARDGRHN